MIINVKSVWLVVMLEHLYLKKVVVSISLFVEYYYLIVLLSTCSDTRVLMIIGFP